MTQVLNGVRVLEVAQFTFVPSAGAVMSDWGADVIKIEHPERGDAQRGMTMLQRLAVNPKRSTLMHHPNRGKRSVGVDLTSEEGQALIYEMVKSCDVFLTNYLPSQRRKLKIDVEDLRKHNPKLIYARGSAHGDKGPDRERGGFDSTAFWARGGSADLVTPRELGGPLTQPGPAYGDTIGGMFIAGGIAAALFRRERTGEPAELDVSLLAAGVWATACSVDVAMELGANPFSNPLPDKAPAGANPLVGVFRTADSRYINLTVLQPGPYLKDTFEHLGVPELMDDPRFNTDLAVMANAEACKGLLVEAVAKHPFKYWLQRLQTMRGQWAPYQDVYEVSEDPQVLANDMIFEVEAPDGGKPLKLVASPVQFDHTPVRNTRGPEASEHTEMVLEELGIGWDRILDLKSKGAIA